MREAQIEANFVAEARKVGCHAVKFTDPAERGAPDRLVLCPNGFVFFIEFKRPGCRLRPEQDRYHVRLRNLGLYVCVCDSVADAVDVLFFLMNRTALK